MFITSLLLTLACSPDPVPPTSDASDGAGWGPARVRFVDARYDDAPTWRLYADVAWDSQQLAPAPTAQPDCGSPTRAWSELPLDPEAARSAGYRRVALPAFSSDMAFLEALPGDHVDLSEAVVGDDCEVAGDPTLQADIAWELPAWFELKASRHQDCLQSVEDAWCAAQEALYAAAQVVQPTCVQAAGVTPRDTSGPSGSVLDPPTDGCHTCGDAVRSARLVAAEADHLLARCRRTQAALSQQATTISQLIADGGCVGVMDVDAWAGGADELLDNAHEDWLQASRDADLALARLSACSAEVAQASCEACLDREASSSSYAPVGLAKPPLVMVERERLVETFRRPPDLDGHGDDEDDEGREPDPGPELADALSALSADQVHYVIVPTDGWLDDALAVLGDRGGDPQLVILLRTRADAPDLAAADATPSADAVGEALEILGSFRDPSARAAPQPARLAQ